MAHEITIYDEELTVREDQIRKGIIELQGLNGEARSEKLFELERNINSCKQMFSTLRVELRELPKSEVAEYEAKARAHQQALRKLTEDLKFQKTAGDRDQLLDGRSGGFNAETATAQQLLDHGKQTLNEDEKILQRTRKVVNDTEQIAAETNVRLKEQTEQIAAAHEAVHQVESNLKKADRLISQIRRKLMSDKIMLCMLVCIMIAIVFIIGWKIAYPDSELNVPDEATVSESDLGGGSSSSSSDTSNTNNSGGSTTPARLLEQLLL
eukprot:GFYU01003763.1.p1 GENE.GFYU01003763.1~~GFYU01003763.1.p1  ORF type:complete len:267 (-),score=71.88 GFYU01003763.1:262-1062(-)